MTLDVVNSQNQKIGSVDLRDEVFGGRIKTDLIHESVVRANAAERTRHARDEEPRARQRQRQEAVASEGHRPRACR
jgi:ribosomal protein L4